MRTVRNSFARWVLGEDDKTMTDGIAGQASSAKPEKTTILQYLDVIFPQGFFVPSLIATETTSSVEPNHRVQLIPAEAPFHPADVFGAMGQLLSVSGAYSQFAVRVGSGRGYELTTAEIDNAVALGREWRLDVPQSEEDRKRLVKNLGQRRDEAQQTIASIWNDFVDRYGQHELYDRKAKVGPHPQWWKRAHYLLIAADEAAGGIINFTEQGSERVQVETYWALIEVTRWINELRQIFLDEVDGRTDNGDVTGAHAAPASISPSLDREYVCVQPKRRTPMVGCTLRTLSHHLSLLPPRGTVRTGVYLNVYGGHQPEETRSLNILAIPFPYQIHAKWFRPAGQTGYPDGNKDHDTHHSMFELEQKWLGSMGSDGGLKPENKKHIVKLVSNLLGEARKDVGQVDAVVFPEYALDWETYKFLAEHIRSDERDVEFLISGSSSNCEIKDGMPNSGNFAMSTYFYESRTGNRKEERFMLHTSRSKHHRWCLTGSQIEAYGLASELDPRRSWWEDIHLPEREIHLHHFRANSIYTVMICEDLARSDPCHHLLRSVAPNLMFALLMDGPQIVQRWPARYATVLAEDPGTSVLTLTSRALIQRSNDGGGFPTDWTVALWRDDVGSLIPIECRPGDDATLITLSGISKKEMSIDSRTSESIAWRHHGHRPIRLTSEQVRTSLAPILT